jgi:hypothetical protein
MILQTCTTSLLASAISTARWTEKSSLAWTKSPLPKRQWSSIFNERDCAQAKRASSWKCNCGFPNSKSLFSGTDEPWTRREKREIPGSGLQSGRTCHRLEVIEGEEMPNGGGKRRRNRGWRLANDAKALLRQQFDCFNYSRQKLASKRHNTQI